MTGFSSFLRLRGRRLFPSPSHSVQAMTHTPSKKSTRHRGLHLSRTQRKALRRRSQNALRYWKFLTRCFTSLRRRPAFRWIRAFKRLRTAFGALALACWLPTLAQADTFTVNSNSDISEEEDGDLTLREAITRANENPGPDTIDFTDELSGAVIKLTQGELAISDDLSIDASGLAEAPIIDADEKSRVMHFTESEGDLVLTKLTLRNGRVRNGHGGGVLSASSGSLILVNSLVSDHFVQYGNGGGLFSRGTITLQNSTIRGNVSMEDLANLPIAPGDSNIFEGQGGGIYSGGALTITESTISGNYGHLGGGGVYSRSGSVILKSSTVSGNRCDSYYSRGGGIRLNSSSITISHSTITQNGSSTGGGIFFGVSVGEAVKLSNSIVAGNFVRWEDIYSPPVSVFASDLLFFSGSPTTLEVSHCLIGTSRGARLDEAQLNENNLIDVDPLLAPLADNGGPTQTMLPYPESPVINAGARTWHTADQRGLAHTGAPDIGAVEFQGTSDLPRVLPLDHDGDGSSFQIEKAVGTNPFVADPNDPRLLQRPVFNAEGQAVLSFGIAETALPGTRWILERTTDLLTFEAIHRFDGTEHLTYEGRPVTITETDFGVSVIDEAPPTGRVFYRLRIALAE